jgi:kynurenine formamidase
VQETGDASLSCEGHRAKGEIGYSHLEKLQNLEMLPADGFEIVCSPVEVYRASAGWTRAVTILPA